MKRTFWELFCIVCLFFWACGTKEKIPLDNVYQNDLGAPCDLHQYFITAGEFACLNFSLILKKSDSFMEGVDLVIDDLPGVIEFKNLGGSVELTDWDTVREVTKICPIWIADGVELLEKMNEDRAHRYLGDVPTYNVDDTEILKTQMWTLEPYSRQSLAAFTYKIVRGRMKLTRFYDVDGELRVGQLSDRDILEKAGSTILTYTYGSSRVSLPLSQEIVEMKGVMIRYQLEIKAPRDIDSFEIEIAIPVGHPRMKIDNFFVLLRGDPKEKLLWVEGPFAEPGCCMEWD